MSLMPLFISLMFLVVLTIWSIMTGRWAAADWKVIGVSFLLMSGFQYLLFFGFVALRRFSIPSPPMPLIGVVGAAAFVVIVSRLRKRFERSSTE
jgi:hypothetical protein